MVRTLIVGYGNPLRGDDGIGVYLAEQLQEKFFHPSEIQIITQHQLIPELVEDIQEAERVIFIDANARNMPGEISVEKSVAEQTMSQSISHSVSPQSLLMMCQTLYGKTPSAWIVSIGGEDFDYQEGLSKTLKDQVPVYMARIVNLIEH